MEHETRTSDDDLSRRSFLGRGAATGLGIALTGSIGSVFGASPARGDTAADSVPGYGPPVPDPAGLLALPAGFSYKLLAKSNVTRLDSGEATPDSADGTACFVRHGGNGSVLVVNHENNSRSTRLGRTWTA